MDGWRHAESASMYQPNGTDIREMLPGQVSAQILQDEGATITNFLAIAGITIAIFLLAPGSGRDDFM